MSAGLKITVDPPEPIGEEQIPDGYELIDGSLVEKETSWEHGRAQFRFGVKLAGFDRRAGGPPEKPGGWWITCETLIDFGLGQKFRPDVAGWRREKLAQSPQGAVVRQIPDWICEILSPGNHSNDTVIKFRTYHRRGVAHYWLLDPVAETLEVYRWQSDGYLRVLSAIRDESVRAEPFEAIEVTVGSFLGDDD
jgi:Uma2 family endonuclease